MSAHMSENICAVVQKPDRNTLAAAHVQFSSYLPSTRNSSIDCLNSPHGHTTHAQPASFDRPQTPPEVPEQRVSLLLTIADLKPDC